MLLFLSGFVRLSSSRRRSIRMRGDGSEGVVGAVRSQHILDGRYASARMPAMATGTIAMRAKSGRNARPMDMSMKS